MQVKRSQMMEASREKCTLTKNYCLDITGPTLPHNMQMLKKVLDQSDSHYTVQSHVSGTSAFNQYFTERKNSI